MSLILRQARTEQPRQYTPIDWSNPLTRGLVAAFVFDEPSAGPRDRVGGRKGSGSFGPGVGTALRYAEPSQRHGRTLYLDGSYVTWQPESGKSPFELADAFSVAWGGQYNTRDTGTAIFWALFKSDRTNHLQARGSGGQLEATIGASAYVFPSTNTDAQYDNRIVESCLTWSAAAATARWYHNGSELSSVATTTSPSNLGADPYLAVGGNHGLDANVSYDGKYAYLYVFNRELSASEARALSDNPWQLFAPQPRRLWSIAGEGTSAVTADLEGIYGVIAIVVSDLAANHAVAALVAGDLAGAYAVAQPVAADAVGAYAVLSPITGDLAAAYGVEAPVLADRTGVYEVLVAAEQEHAGSYAVLTDTGVSADYAGAYGVTAPVQAERPGAYAVLAPIDADRASEYIVLAPVAQDLAGAYGVIARAEADLGGAYSVVAPTQNDLAGGYGVMAPVAADREGAYALFAAVVADLAAAYAVEEAGGAGGGASAAQVWNFVLPNGLTAKMAITQLLALLDELHRLHGLSAGDPLVVTPTSRTVGDIAQTISTAGSTVTVERTA